MITPLIERLRLAAPGILMDIVGVAEDVAGDLAASKIDVAITAGWWLRHARNREPLRAIDTSAFPATRNASISRPMPVPSMFWWHRTDATRASSTARCVR